MFKTGELLRCVVILGAFNAIEKENLRQLVLPIMIYTDRENPRDYHEILVLQSGCIGMIEENTEKQKYNFPFIFHVDNKLQQELSLPRLSVPPAVLLIRDPVDI